MALSGTLLARCTDVLSAALEFSGDFGDLDRITLAVLNRPSTGYAKREDRLRDVVLAVVQAANQAGRDGVLRLVQELRSLNAQYAALDVLEEDIRAELAFPVYSVPVSLQKPAECDPVGRDQDLEKLKSLLAGRNTAMIAGWPGVGKSFLASLLIKDPDIQALFPDGVLAAGLGQIPDAASSLGIWCEGLKIKGISSKTTVEERKRLISERIRDRRLLIIMDDVWDDGPRGIECVGDFKVGGDRCGHVFTTRAVPTANRLADWLATRETVLELGELDEDSALDLLEKAAGFLRWLTVDAVRQRALAIFQEVSRLPYGLTIIGNMLGNKYRDQIEYGSTEDRCRALQEVLELLQQANLTDLPPDTSGTPQQVWKQVWKPVVVAFEGLQPHYQQQLRQLAVFPSDPSSFSREAAADVLGIEPGEWIGSKNSPGVGIMLMRSGLLQPVTPVAQGAVTTRYKIHRTITNYLRHEPQVTPPGNTSSIDIESYRRMIEHYRRVVEQSQEYTALEDENKNLRAALEKARELDLHPELVRAANAFYDYMEARGLHRDVEEYYQKALEVAEGLPEERHADRVLLLLHCGRLEEKLGNYSIAENILEEGLKLARETNNAAEVDLLYILSIVEYNRGKYHEAREHLQKAIKLLSTPGYEEKKSLRAHLLQRLGLVCFARGWFLEAARHEMDGLRFAREQQNDERIVACLVDLGRIALKLGDYELAARYVQDGMNSLQRRERVEHICALKQIMSRVVLEQTKDIEHAKAHLDQAFKEAEDSLHRWYMSFLKHEYGKLYLFAKRPEEAARAFEESLDVAISKDISDLRAYALFGLARVAAERNERPLAREHASESLIRFRDIMHHMGDEVERWLVRCHLQDDTLPNPPELSPLPGEIRDGN